MSSGKSDTAQMIPPIELGSPTIVQILNARNSASNEILDYLENECDAILECRKCRSMFRSLANFIAHKRAYCKGLWSNTDARLRYPEHQTLVIQPTDPDTDNLRAKPWNPKKRKPVKHTAVSSVPTSSLHGSNSVSPSASCTTTTSVKPVTLTPIDGVACAVQQSVMDDESSYSLADSMNKSENSVTIVHPKDGYPNMNLRKRNVKSQSQIDLDDDFYYDEDEELPGEDSEEYEEQTDGSFQPTGATSSSADGTAKILAKRNDCDVKSLRCLVCNTRFSTLKTLNFHMINLHGKQRKFYPCIYCKNVFSQFWGVTRHLKRSHGLTSDGVDRIRERIRARVFTRNLGGNSSDQCNKNELHTDSDNKQTANGGSGVVENSMNTSQSKVSDDSLSDKEKLEELAKTLQCDLCGKEFGKKQYLFLHRVACAKKAGKPVIKPPTSTPPSNRSNKPLLFVCKTCNRAFSMRQNMAQHAVACARKHKMREDAAKNAAPIQESDSKEMVKPKMDDTSSSAKKEEKREAAPAAAETTQQNKTNSNTTVTSDSEKRDAKNLEDADEILLQLSPSDEAKEEESKPEATQKSLSHSRPKRNIKPKQFHDGTVRIPEVVKIKQADGSLVYKLREDVEAAAVAKPSKLTTVSTKSPQPAAATESTTSITIKETSSGLDILVEGQTVPLLGPDDEAKIERMIDMRKLVCLKCKKEYGSISNLRRHAVRHLGWRRYKCKLCKFTAYNKSECKTHLRKSHAKETSTLLDYGLHPYIIDLGALLDDVPDDSQSEFSISVSESADEGCKEPKPSPKSPKTRSRAKGSDMGDISDSVDQGPANSTTQTQDSPAPTRVSTNRRVRSRVRKAELSPTSSTGSDMLKTRGSTRKHNLGADSDTDGGTQDENTKRARTGSAKSQTQSDSESGNPKQEGKTSSSKAETTTVTVEVDSAKQKEQVNKLEGVVSNLKNRTPLRGTTVKDDNLSNKSAEKGDTVNNDQAITEES